MNDCPQIKNPLILGGTSQVERLLTALLPASFKIDDRGLDELVAATHRYAQLLAFRNENDQTQGDWTCFWEIETLTFLAIVSAVDTDSLRRDYEEEVNRYNALAEEEQTEDAEAEFALNLIKQIKTLAERVEHYYHLLPDSVPLRAEILALIRKDTETDTEQLSGALHTLISYHKEAYPKTLDAPQDLSHNQYTAFFTERWGIDGTAAFYRLPFSADYQLNGYEALDKLFEEFHQALVKIKQRAGYWFERNLATPQLREPHVALYLAFLRLFDHARNDLNDLTRRHLEFYYDEVLHLCRRPAVPNEVHLLFELANHVDQYFVEGGTELLAGIKDENKRPLIYRSLEDWVVRKAQVAEIKTTYLDLSRADAAQVHAQADVKQKFQQGQLLRNQSADAFRPMGDNRHLPWPELGFAIASPQLILEEGRRTLTAHLHFEQGIPLLATSRFNAYVSSEAEWLQLSRPPFGNEEGPVGTEGSSYQLLFDQAEMKIGPLEATRRLVSDLTADIGVYPAGSATNADVAAIYNRTGAEVDLLSRNIYRTAYSAIRDINGGLAINSQAGSLYFLRAYFYWSLAKTFAPPYFQAEVGGNLDELTDLPKLLTSGDDLGGERFTVGELYDQIADDLKRAQSSLPDDPSGISRWAALAFLSRLHLEMGNYQTALSAAGEILNSGLFALAPSPSAVFEFTAEAHPEAIWWYDVDNEEGDVFGLYNWHGPDGQPSNQLLVAPSQHFLMNISGWIDDGEETQEALGDARYRDLFHKVRADENTPPQAIWANKYYRGSLNDQHRVVILRYAEVILNAATAELALGNLAQALAWINQLRARSGISPLASIDFDSFLRERAIELAFEGDRRDILQALRRAIPNGDRNDGNIDWLDAGLYFTPPTAIDLEEGASLGFRQVTLQAELAPDFPAVTAFADTTQPGTIATQWPLLKFGFNPQPEPPAAVLRALLEARLERIDLNVEVEGIRENLVVHTDQGVFDGTQEVQLFGSAPKRGNFVRIGSHEALRKSVQDLRLHFEWIDPPNFAAYHNNYLDANGSAVTNIDPEIRIDFLEGATFTPQTGRRTAGTNRLEIGEASLLTLKGTVRYPDGRPIVNLPVFALRTESETVTDLNGEFVFNWSEPSTPATLIFSAFDQEDNPRYLIVGSDIKQPRAGEMEVVVTLKEYWVENLVQNDDNLPNYGSLLSDYELLTDLGRYGDTLGFERYRPTLPQGFMKVELVNGDFLHGLYSNSLVAATLHAANAGTTGAAAIAGSLPHTPYSPATNGISLDYVSKQTIAIGAANDGIDQYYHILPFNGYREVALNKGELESIPLMNPYRGHDGEAEAGFAPGNLYIGLTGLEPNTNLSLLIQVREGTEVEPDWLPPALQWSYLAEDNTWLPLTADRILKDTTFGLTRTGVVQLSLPPTMVQDNTMLNDELYWLRVAAYEQLDATPPRSAKALPDVVTIRAQVVTARFEDRDNELGHLAQALPAATVTKLLVSRSEIKKIEQPFASVNGRPAEAGNEFYRRVSERLRHRDRAVTIWDYERLLLEQYPNIQRAKCMNHTSLTTELAPGYVTVAVIPDRTRREGAPSATPRFSGGDLVEMANYLRTKTNLFVAKTEADDSGNVTEAYLRVVNPLFETIRLRFDVRFRPGVDVAYHRYLLDEELQHYLSPWLKDAAFEMRFNQSLHRSRIVHFIEERPYVDVVLHLKIEHDGVLVNSEEIRPKTSRSILTTFVQPEKTADETAHHIRTFTKKSELTTP